MDWIDSFKKGEIIVNCETKYEAEEFTRALHENGMSWFNGRSLLSYIGFEYSSQSCYRAGTPRRLSMWSREKYEADPSFQHIQIVTYSSLVGDDTSLHPATDDALEMLFMCD